MNKYLKWSVACVLIAMVSGCSSFCSRPNTVYITTSVPKPPVVDRPQLKVYEITPESSEGQVVMYWRATVQQLIEYSKQLEDIINGYKKISEESGK